MQSDHFLKYLFAIVLFLCISVVGGGYLWRSAPDSVEPPGSVLPMVGSLEESSSGNSAAKPTSGKTAVSPTGEAWRLESSLDGVAFKWSPDDNTAPETVPFQRAMRVSIIHDFQDRWTYAYSPAGINSDETDRAGRTPPRLERIGTRLERGSDKAATLAEQLDVTRDPLELALLAEVLETQAPGLYRDAILDAACETLTNVAYEENPRDEPYMGPVFELLQQYGDESVVADLQDVPPRWQPYATVALAKMPQGEGVPALIEVVQENGALRRLEGQRALALLAQVSLEDALAYETLVEKARTGVIPSHVWRNIAAVLAGDHQSQIEPPDTDAAFDTSGSVMGPSPYRTQTFFYGDGVRQVIYLMNQSAVLSDGELEQRLVLIDGLKAETSNPNAILALETARNALLSRTY